MEEIHTSLRRVFERELRKTSGCCLRIRGTPIRSARICSSASDKLPDASSSPVSVGVPNDFASPMLKVSSVSST